MSAESDLYYLLTYDPGIPAPRLLTTLINGRVYPDVADQSASSPLVVYQRAATDLDRNLYGSVLGTRTTLLIFCYAETKEQAEQVADVVAGYFSGTEFDLVGRAGGYDPESMIFNVTLTVIHYQ